MEDILLHADVCSDTHVFAILHGDLQVACQGLVSERLARQEF